MKWIVPIDQGKPSRAAIEQPNTIAQPQEMNVSEYRCRLNIPEGTTSKMANKKHLGNRYCMNQFILEKTKKGLLFSNIADRIVTCAGVSVAT
jgi:hypothetical protein